MDIYIISNSIERQATYWHGGKAVVRTFPASMTEDDIRSSIMGELSETPKPTVKTALPTSPDKLKSAAKAAKKKPGRKPAKKVAK